MFCIQKIFKRWKSSWKYLKKNWRNVVNIVSLALKKKQKQNQTKYDWLNFQNHLKPSTLCTKFGKLGIVLLENLDLTLFYFNDYEKNIIWLIWLDGHGMHAPEIGRTHSHLNYWKLHIKNSLWTKHSWYWFFPDY